MAFAPEGVDYALYSTPVAAPADIANIPHPRIGYTGNLKEQLGWPLLHALASRHKDMSFVFVGPTKLTGWQLQLLEEMKRMPNVHFLGSKTVWELAAYPQHFDVCLMPYAITGYTNNIYPLKLHEYLAGGRPVVGARIRSLLDFDHVIALPTTPDDWSSAIADAMLPSVNTREAVAARRDVARQYDWSEIIYKIANVICERLGPSFVERLHDAHGEGGPRRERATSSV
jgi:glycosyltransferase involved in cell wall biosynthesis